MSWFRRKTALTPVQAEDCQRAFDRLNGIVAEALELWPGVHDATATLYSVAKRSLTNDENAYPLSQELLQMAREGRAHLVSYQARLKTLRADFAAVTLPEWTPPKFKEEHAETTEMFFDGQIGFLDGSIQALSEPNPLVYDGSGPHKPNMLYSGLNLVAQMRQTVRPFRLKD